MARRERSVLVAVVGREKDLSLARRARWYRIPARHAPRRGADYLALYQTAAFGSRGRSIRYFATIRAVSSTSRKQLLPDEERHPRASGRYLRLALGPLRRTPHVIRNRTRRRMTFGFTTLSKLRRATEVCQLFDISPVEEIMRRALARARIPARHEHCMMERKRLRYRLDFAIFCRRGQLAVECDNERFHQSKRQRVRDRRRDRWLTRRGWTVLRLPGAAIRDDPKGCVRKVKAAIRKLGGVAR